MNLLKTLLRIVLEIIFHNIFRSRIEHAPLIPFFLIKIKLLHELLSSKKKKIKETRKSTKLLDGTPYNAPCISPIISKSLTMQVQHPVKKAFPSSSTDEDRVFSRDERENFSLRVSPLRRVAPLSQKKGEVPRLDYEHRHGWS